MSNARVRTIGLHIADVLGRYVDAIPEGQGLTLLDEIKLTVAGTAAAPAVNLARLGVPIATTGVVGEDALGQFVRDQMTREGVDVSGLRSSAAAPTSASMLNIRRDGSRPALHVVGANGQISADDLGDSILEGIEHIHLGGVGLMPGIDGDTSVEFLRRAKDRGITVTVDLLPTDGGASDHAALDPILPLIDYILPSDDDSLLLTGAETYADAARWFLDRGVGTAIITLGAEGVSISSGDSIDVRYPTTTVDVVDTTGCGDAFAAGFIRGLLDGEPVEEAARLGMACGSLVATGLGSDAGLESYEQANEFRKQHIPTV
ncbi:carbohydrate kinase family protein [Georgenia sp. Z1344]|uniref:carbohydrate kinase family protein n=1 Tax=Georgenia sp. Z1344 TaxID=3416706 RepID=UPI003CE9A3AE